MGFRQRAAEYGEILGKDVDLPAVDRAPPCDYAITGDFLVRHAEIDGAMGDIHVEFFERTLVEQHLDPFAGRQLAFGMLGLDPPDAAAQPRLRATLFDLVQHCPHISSQRMCECRHI
ncbi:hypothetical protein D3C71_1211230 [compost metagenome]